MKNISKLFITSTCLALALTACKKGEDETDNPGGAGANPEVPSAKAKEDFNKVVARYNKAKSDGKLEGAECDSLSKAFHDVYTGNKKSMRIAEFNAGAVWEECGKPDKAKEIYEGLAKTNYHLAYNNLGVLYWNKGETKKALDLFEKSVKADPKQSFHARNNLAAARRDRFADRVDMADFKEAEKQIQNILAVDTSNKAAYENLARLYYDRGRLKDASYLVLSNLVVQQALRVLEKEGQKSADIMNLKGLLLMQDENLVDALKAFKAAAEIDGKHIDANLNIAFISIRFRDYASAETALKVAMKDSRVKKDVEAHIAMGVSKRGLKKFSEAEKAYAKASEVAPKDPRPWYNLGILSQEHLIGQDGVDAAKIEEFYNVAKKHYSKFISMAGGNKELADKVQDAKDRIVIIDDAIATFRIMEELEKKAKELEALEKKQAEEERKRLLDLEKQAEAAAEAESAPPAAEEKKDEKKDEKKEEKK